MANPTGASDGRPAAGGAPSPVHGGVSAPPSPPPSPPRNAGTIAAAAGGGSGGGPNGGRRSAQVFGLFSGAGFLLRGLGMYVRSPRLMLLGMVPAVVAATVLVGAFIAMINFVDGVAAWATPFADDWSSGLRETTRLLAAVAIAAGWTLLSVVAFVALTLVIGQPFYEAISKRVEDQVGGVPDEIDVSFWRTLPRSLVDSIRLLLFGAACGVPIFFIGLIPVVGQVAAPVLGAIVGGWVLAIELTSVPFERRGLRLRDRRRVLKSRRFTSLGFGIATFVCFLIPLGAVLLMPAAVAGATLLSRRLLGLPDAAAR